MRRFALFSLAAVFSFAFNTQAQGTPQSSPLFVSPFDETTTNTQPGGELMADAATPSWLRPLDLAPFASESSSGAPATAASATAPTPDPPQGVYGVKPNYEFQGYFGYTFLRFYEVPNTTVNTNGFNYSIVYFPHQLKYWVGADGEFVLGLGSQGPYQARFLLGLGGVRVRWAPFTRTNVEIWAHGLAGASHYTPQTAYGSQGAFGYEAGVGVDINAHRWRYAYRFSADMVGTRYFGTYQLSPKLSAGFVYKF
jgi:hypothetical protein